MHRCRLQSSSPTGPTPRSRHDVPATNQPPSSSSDSATMRHWSAHSMTHFGALATTDDIQRVTYIWPCLRGQPWDFSNSLCLDLRRNVRFSSGVSAISRVMGRTVPIENLLGVGLLSQKVAPFRPTDLHAAEPHLGALPSPGCSSPTLPSPVGQTPTGFAHPLRQGYRPRRPPCPAQLLIALTRGMSL